MSTREIVGHPRELYGLEVSPDLISALTDAVLVEVANWQARPLEPVYPIVFFDAVPVKVRDEGVVRNKAVHIALGVRADVSRDPRALAGVERGRQVLVAGHDRAEEPWPRGRAACRGRWPEGLPRCDRGSVPRGAGPDLVVHLLRHSLDSVSDKDRKLVAGALKDIHRALDAGADVTALEAFEASEKGRRYVAIAQGWRRARGEVIPLFAFPGEVRRLLCTTNAIWAQNATLRRAVRARGHFSTDEAALKMLYLVLNCSEKAWKISPCEWGMAEVQFAVIFGDRFTRAMAA